MKTFTRWSLSATTLFGLLFASLGIASADLGWRPYVDPVLGYSLVYPAALFDGPPVREHGGITITSTTGARLYIFGGRNPDGRPPEVVAAELSGSADVAQVTYRRLTDDWLVLSGYLAGGPQQAPGSIFYERIALSADRTRLAGFRVVYSPADRAIFDRVIAPLGRSLKAPPALPTASVALVPPAPGALTHREWCSRQYSTYDPARDSYLRYDGRYVPCVGPAQ